MRRPSYCPSCGSPLPGDEASKTLVEIEGGYDCYCPCCRWSGDIMPDEELRES
jgi:hypothetical protein